MDAYIQQYLKSLELNEPADPNVIRKVEDQLGFQYLIENKNAWENINIPDYHESMQAWLTDAGDDVLDENKWNLLYSALEASKFYE